VPIFHRLVYEFYLGTLPPIGAYGEAPRRLRPLLQADLRVNRAWLAGLAAQIQTPHRKQMAALRAADIIIWEHAATGCTQDEDRAEQATPIKLHQESRTYARRNQTIHPAEYLRASRHMTAPMEAHGMIFRRVHRPDDQWIMTPGS